MDTCVAEPPLSAPRAPGSGRIEVRRASAGSVVTGAYATSPLRVLTPRNHGNAAWVYLSSYGGGLVGGDRVAIDVEVGTGAGLYLSTQASTKVYRSPLPTQTDLRARVLSGALFVLAPDPVVCFRGSTYRQRQSVDVAADASLVVVDWMSAGRLVTGERWAFDEYVARLDVRVDDAPVLHDVTALRASDGDLPRRMGRFNVLATIILAGSPLAAHGAVLQDRIAKLRVDRRSVHVTAAPLGGHGCLLRLAGISVELTARVIRDSLRFVPDLLGDDPWVRKW